MQRLLKTVFIAIFSGVSLLNFKTLQLVFILGVHRFYKLLISVQSSGHHCLMEILRDGIEIQKFSKNYKSSIMKIVRSKSLLCALSQSLMLVFFSHFIAVDTYAQKQDCLRPLAILITGPTSVGKSKSAQSVVLDTNGHLINADTMFFF